MIGSISLMVSRWFNASLMDQSTIVVDGLHVAKVVDETKGLLVVKVMVVVSSSRLGVVVDEAKDELNVG